MDDNCDEIADNITPKKVTLKSPSEATEEIAPTFTWNEDTNTTWYKVFIWDSSEQEIYSR